MIPLLFVQMPLNHFARQEVTRERAACECPECDQSPVSDVTHRKTRASIMRMHRPRARIQFSFELERTITHTIMLKCRFVQYLHNITAVLSYDGRKELCLWENEERVRSASWQRLFLKGQQRIKRSVSKVNQRTKGTEKITHCSWLMNFCNFNKN